MLSTPQAGQVQQEMSTLLDRLAPRLQANARIESVRRLTGGASQQTWAFDLATPAGRVPLILRHAPTDVSDRVQMAGFDVEVAAISAAHANGVPVPRIHHLLEPRDELGKGFVCEFIAGETIGRKIQRAPRYEAVRPGLTRQFGEVAALVHATPTAGLPCRTSGIAETLARIRVLLDSDPAPRPTFERAYRWLHDNAPDEPAIIALVHGDYRLGNVIVDEQGLRAVLDWEQVHLGDPMEDLAWLMLPPWRFGEHAFPVAGLGSREALFDAYEDRGGIAPDRRRVAWWVVFGSLRWGNACGRMASWCRSGSEATVEQAMIARRASESEFDVLVAIAEAESGDV